MTRLFQAIVFCWACFFFCMGIYELYGVFCELWRRNRNSAQETVRGPEKVRDTNTADGA